MGLPSNVDFDDLVSSDFLAWWMPSKNLTRARGVKFETYAVIASSGAVIDGLRSIDWVPRSVRQKAKELENTWPALEAKLGRPATDAEVSEALNLSLEEYHELLSQVKGITLASLDEVWTGDPEEEGKIRFGQMIENTASEDPSALVEEVEVKRLLAEAIDQLPERERLVVSLYYYEGLTLKEIGRSDRRLRVAHLADSHQSHRPAARAAAGGYAKAW